MSGNQCSDIGGVSLPTQQGATPLCVMPENHPYAGVVTYRDGRVVTLDPKNPGAGNFDAARTNELSGAELGDCSARDNNKSLSFLQTTYKGSPVTWTARDLKEVYRILGQAEGQTGNAYFCSNREDRTRVALNNDVAHLPSLRASIETLQKNHGTLDDLHFNALLESLRTAAGVPAPVDHTSDLVGVGIVFTLVGVATGIIGFVAKAVWDKISKGPKDGDGPKPPSGGGGGGKNVPELPTFAINELPEGADVMMPGGFVVKDGQVIGKAGQFKREGLITADQGAYICRFQATIDGEVVGLTETMARSLAAARNANFNSDFFYAGDFTAAQFDAAIGSTSFQNGIADADPAAAYRALVGNGSVNYGALGYARSTDTAVAVPGTLSPGFQPTVAPLTFGGAGATSSFRLPSIAIEPVLVPAR